jgi:hypothetical protein
LFHPFLVEASEVANEEAHSSAGLVQFTQYTQSIALGKGANDFGVDVIDPVGPENWGAVEMPSAGILALRLKIIDISYPRESTSY